MRPYGPSPGSLDLAQVALSPGQSPEVRAGTVRAAQAATIQPRRRPQPQGLQYRRRQQPQSRLVVAEAILVALHQHFKAGPDLQPAHQTTSTIRRRPWNFPLGCTKPLLATPT